jgi:hypothetical protein
MINLRIDPLQNTVAIRESSIMGTDRQYQSMSIFTSEALMAEFVVWYTRLLKENDKESVIKDWGK